MLDYTQRQKFKPEIKKSLTSMDRVAMLEKRYVRVLLSPEFKPLQTGT